MSDLRIVEQLLPYHERLETRDVSKLEMIVLHCTELPDLRMAREFGERITLPESQTGFSGHYYVDRDGIVYQYVFDDRVARHVIGHNANTIGIELVNLGRYPHWFHSQYQACGEPYSQAQMESLRKLLACLKSRHPGVLRIARHSDLDQTTLPAEDNPQIHIRRKVDPGPMFPWEEFLSFWGTL